MNTRYVPVDSNEAAVIKMKEEQFAYMQATQAIYGILARSGDECNIVQIGPNLFNGNLVIAWGKQFPYAPLFNY